MGGRGELTDGAWARLQPLLPCNGHRGKQWRDHRRVLGGILWVMRHGGSWREVPAEFGAGKTDYDRYTLQ